MRESHPPLARMWIADSIRVYPTSIPPDPLIKVMISALDENLSKLSLTPSFRPTCYRRDYPMHSLQLVDRTHELDKDFHRMTGSNCPTSAWTPRSPMWKPRSVSLSSHSPLWLRRPEPLSRTNKCVFRCKRIWWNLGPCVAMLTCLVGLGHI